MDCRDRLKPLKLACRRRPNSSCCQQAQKKPRSATHSNLNARSSTQPHHSQFLVFFTLSHSAHSAFLCPEGSDMSLASASTCDSRACDHGLRDTLDSQAWSRGTSFDSLEPPMPRKKHSWQSVETSKHLCRQPWRGVSDLSSEACTEHPSRRYHERLPSSHGSSRKRSCVSLSRRLCALLGRESECVCACVRVYIGRDRHTCAWLTYAQNMTSHNTTSQYISLHYFTKHSIHIT